MPVVALVCGMLPIPVEAQFSQQAKLVGTGTIGLDAQQGDPSRCLWTGIPPSSVGPTTILS